MDVREIASQSSMRRNDFTDRPEDTPTGTPKPERAGVSTGSAVVTGNLAGVVESADSAWTRLTGFPLDQTIEKPITHFLDRAGIEVELVDFVSQHFLEGRPCTLEFPFETFDGRSIQVHLEVEPIRNEAGEIETFRAIARETLAPPPSPLPEATRAPRISRENSHGPDRVTERQRKPAHTSPVASSQGAFSSLAATIGPALESARTQVGSALHFDVELDPGLPPIGGDPADVERLFQALFSGARENLRDRWGCITIVAGQTQAGRSSHHSLAHPVPVRTPILAERPHVYLEVHDTGQALSRVALRRIVSELACLDPEAGGEGDGKSWTRAVDPESTGDSQARRIAMLEATRAARALGATLLWDSTPGCGNQALVLF